MAVRLAKLPQTFSRNALPRLLRNSIEAFVRWLVVSGFDQTKAGIWPYHVCMGNLDALRVR
jgi:hypothetical protein